MTKPDPANSPTQWHTKGLLNKIEQLHQNNHDRAFAFILGAGASVNSNIPAAAALAKKWLQHIYEREVSESQADSLPIEAWAAERLEISDFSMSNIAAHYSSIFEACFAEDPPSGYAELEKVMLEAVPSLGYSVLASILDQTRHKAVVTTNFDNLVADALAMQALLPPLIVGHESLAGFVRPNMRRPLVAKIHRDLHLHPKNTRGEVDTLEQGWKEALTRLFQHYTPIIVGYGGNDGSLMGFLDELDPKHTPGQLFWCYYEKDFPNDNIQRIVTKHNGVISPIAGFDEFMVQLASKMLEGFQLDGIAESIDKTGKQRAADCAAQTEKLLEKLALEDRSVTSETSKQATHSVSQVSKAATSDVMSLVDWWAWQLRINRVDNLDEKESLFKQAIEHIPQSPELKGNFANFLRFERKNLELAEEYYKQALKVDDNHADSHGNYALFLQNIRKDYYLAELHYQKAIELDPTGVNKLGNYAYFLEQCLKNYDYAESLYKRALDLAPFHANNLNNFGSFLSSVRKNQDDSETYLLRALEIEPDHIEALSNYALLLRRRGNNDDKAEEYFNRAINVDPTYATNLCNYALFLQSVRCNYDRAEEFFQKAIEHGFSGSQRHCYYAMFLETIRKDYDLAEKHYKLALELNPKDLKSINNYSIFLRTIRKDEAAAKRIEAMLQEVD